ncbi:MAG: AAA family ATPase [Neisseriales bacterium]|nr:MAG: AAA family ATPase [Neisseriales bacterium]
MMAPEQELTLSIEQIERLFARLAPRATLTVEPFIKKLFAACQNSHYLMLTSDEVAQLQQATPLVGTPQFPAPLILEQNRLYVGRIWFAEQKIARYLIQRAKNFRDIDALYAITLLNQLFPQASIQQQQVLLLALRNALLVVSGKPHTGKTMLAAQLTAWCIAYQAMCHQVALVALVAPNHQSLYALNQALNTIRKLPILSETARSRLPKEAVTLHQLLYSNASQSYHAEHPLPFDVLIVDEASSLDMEDMAQLVDALPSYAKLIMLGNPACLSTEHSTILTELYHTPVFGTTTQHWLHQIGLPLISTSKHTIEDRLSDCLVVLEAMPSKTRHTKLTAWCQAVFNGEQEKVAKALEEQKGISCPITWHTISEPELAQEALNQKAAYFKIATIGEPEAAFAAFWDLMLLTTTSRAAYTINAQQERLLEASGQKSADWYIGRPVVLCDKNSIDTLFIGDIGLTLPTESGLRVYFPKITGQGYDCFLPTHLPKVTTALAMPYFKSHTKAINHLWLWLAKDEEEKLDRVSLHGIVSNAQQSLTLFGSNPQILAKIVAHERPFDRTLHWRLGSHATSHTKTASASTNQSEA